MSAKNKLIWDFSNYKFNVDIGDADFPLISIQAVIGYG